jgi:hypothetical protein
MENNAGRDWDACLMDVYADWREETSALEDAYERWSSAPEADRALAFAAYKAALDREEQASIVYRNHLRRDQLAGGQSPSSGVSARPRREAQQLRWLKLRVETKSIRTLASAVWNAVPFRRSDVSQTFIQTLCRPHRRARPQHDGGIAPMPRVCRALLHQSYSDARPTARLLDRQPEDLRLLRTCD